MKGLKHFVTTGFILFNLLTLQARQDMLAVKFTALSPVFGKSEISVEKGILDKISLDIELSALYSEQRNGYNYALGTTDNVDEFNYRSWFLLKEEQSTLHVLSGKKGYSFQIGPRLYIYRPRKWLSAYLKPEFTFAQYSFNEYEVNHYFEGSEFLESTVLHDRTMRNVGISGNFGTQWVLYNRVLIEWFLFFGVQSSSIDTEDDVVYHGSDSMYYSATNSSTQSHWFPNFEQWLFGPSTAGTSLKVGWKF